jgi:hypothetical protein
MAGSDPAGRPPWVRSATASARGGHLSFRPGAIPGPGCPGTPGLIAQNATRSGPPHTDQSCGWVRDASPGSAKSAAPPEYLPSEPQSRPGPDRKGRTAVAPG